MASPGIPSPANNWLGWQYDPKPSGLTWGSWHPSLKYLHANAHWLHGQGNQFTHNPTWFIGDLSTFDVATAAAIANIKGWWGLPGDPYTTDQTFWNLIDWATTW